MVVDAAFDGRGCAISQATATMLMEEIVGKSLDEMQDAGTRSTSSTCWASRSARCASSARCCPLKVLKAGVWGLEEWPE